MDKYLIFTRNDILCIAVVMFCHSKWPVMGRFLHRAEDQNMTNGDFAWFTFWPQKTIIVEKPWIFHVDPQDPARDHRAYYAVKEVNIFTRAGVISDSTHLFSASKSINHFVITSVGGVAQWLERRSLAGHFPCPALDLQLMDDH